MGSSWTSLLVIMLTQQEGILNLFLFALFLPIAWAQVPTDLAIIDGHNDLPTRILELVKNDLNKYKFEQNLTSDPIWGVANCSECHTDLPKLREGKIGAQFWVSWVNCDTQYRDAVGRTLEQIDLIKRFIRKYPNDLYYATSVDGILDARRQFKIASLIGIEGGHAIDSRLGVLRMMYELGARYLTLTHMCQTPWADSSLVDTSVPVHNLTEFGKKVIIQMNRIGMMVDLSHVSHTVMNQAINASRAPVIFSHSNAWSVANHHRNVHDDTLRLLKSNGGIIMVNFYSNYISTNGNATIKDVINHINHIVDLIGNDHIGIGSDYNGIDKVAKGLEDVSKVPKLFELLQREDPTRWSPDNLHKLASDNFLRVFKAVEIKRDELSAEEPIQNWIPKEDLLKMDEINLIQECTTLLDNLEAYSASSMISYNYQTFAFLIIAVLLYRNTE